MTKLKTFKASSMPLALAQVKRQLGPHAVIVRTRSYKQGGLLGLGSRTMVEVVARPQQEQEDPRSKRKDQTERLRRLYAGVEDRLETSSLAPARPPERVVPPVPVLNAEVAADTPLSKELKSEIGNIKELVENLVREHRQLHAPQMPEQLFDLYLDLVQREVADELAREMIAMVQKQITGDQMRSAHVVQQRLAEVMENMISTGGPIGRNLKGGARVVALIGPTGVGKTTTIAKLAATLKLRQNLKVGLITIDTYRIGAVDQLRMYAQILDVPLKVVLTPAELKEAVRDMRLQMDVVLIDTAGRSQRDNLKIKELKTFLDAAGPDEVHLVLSSTAHHSHMLNAAEEFKKLGVDRLIFTKLDEAISFGVVLGVMRKVDAAVSYVTTGQDVPDDIEVGSGRRLARLMLGLESLSMQDETNGAGVRV